MSMFLNKNGKWDWNLIFIIIIYLIGFMWAGLGELIRGDIDLDTIGSSLWWANLIEKLIVNHMILLGTIFYKINKELEDNTDIVEEERKIKLSVDTQVHPVTFNPFMLKWNIERKKKQYLRIIKGKLDNLEQKVSINSIEAWEAGDRTKDKYCRLRAQLERQYEDEYVERFITSLKVRGFQEIQTTFITNGYTSRNWHSEDDALVPEKTGQKMLYDLGPKVAIMVALITALESIVIQAVESESWVVALIGTFFNVTPLVVQVFIGVSYAARFVKEKIMVDFRKRKEIIAMYLDSLTLKEEPKVMEGGSSDVIQPPNILQE